MFTKDLMSSKARAIVTDYVFERGLRHLILISKLSPQSSFRWVWQLRFTFSSTWVLAVEDEGFHLGRSGSDSSCFQHKSLQLRVTCRQQVWIFPERQERLQRRVVA